MALVKTAYLKEIEFPSGTIKFNYSEKESSFYGNAMPEVWKNFDEKTYCLDSISVYSKLELVTDISFDYEYYSSGNNGYRMYLQSLNNNGKKYLFNYQGLSSLPNPLTSGIDLWGYYNGMNSNSILLPRFSSDLQGIPNPFNVDVQFRKTNPTYNNIGMLSEITYPTGGKTQFTFETHDYNTVLRRTENTGMQPSQENEFGYAGGTRIKQVKNIPGETINYYYKTNFTKNDTIGNNSSGILIDNFINFI